MTKRQLGILLGVLLILGGSYGLMKFFEGLKKDPPKKKIVEQKRYVRTELVDYNDIQTEITAFGRVASSQPLDVASEVAGRILEGNIKLRSGYNFKKGDLLFKIDDDIERLNLQSSKSDLLKMLVTVLPDIKIDFPDSYPMWEGYLRSINLNKDLPEIPQAKSNTEKMYLATKDIYKTYYSIKSAEERLKRFSFYAPYSGSISEVLLEVGSYVSPGNKIARIVRTDQVELLVPVETKDVQWITQGESVTITSENGLQKWEGRISRIGDVVNPNTQSIDVFVSVNAGGAPIFDGLYLKANIPGKTVAQSMIMPRNAIFKNNKVYVIEDDSVLREKEINILKVNKETVVFNGIDENADLVVEPLAGAYNNMKAYKLSDAEKHINLEVTENSAKKKGEAKKKS
ncbi:efflux RND transporter periplasmic adaptor subunit [Flammeovirgaceae bacterium SG7u.111]|nr:efflux RND transporter periplasmic adaptor subunit [Flammeovirgaceae bacterium SG7u.132]WPO35173.1 efflux RND transporter periplasmic adaptor subunit [Flammeovirgaceae bacterium SG7u.111]